MRNKLSIQPIKASGGSWQYRDRKTITFKTHNLPRARALNFYIKEIIKKTLHIELSFFPDITSQKGKDNTQYIKIVPDEF